MFLQKKQSLTNIIIKISLLGLIIMMGLVLGNGYFVQTSQVVEPTPELLGGETSTPFGDVLPTPTLTTTPYPREIRTPDNSTPTYTSMPIPIIDLAEGLPDESKRAYTIKRWDGTYERYLVVSNYSGEIKKLLHLAPQDVIVNAYPLVPLPPSTPELLPTIKSLSISPLSTPSPTSEL